MSEKNPKMPPPLLVSAIICDQVIFDQATKKPSVIGAFETINAPKYPARHARLSFFCQLTNGHGKTEVGIKLIDITNEEKELFSGTVWRDFVDVRQVASLSFAVSGIVFPHPGEYRFQIYAGSEFLGERSIICRELEMPPQEEKHDEPGND